MPYCPERGLGAANPGGHRTSGVSCRSYRTRLHRPEVSAVPETEAAPGPTPGSGRGSAAVGINLVSLIAALREEGRLPVRTIQWYLQTVHQLKLSVGAIVRVVHQVAQQARPAVAEALERIRSSPVVHADETGWRENGVNGYVWTFSTSTERYFLRRGRGGAGWWTRSWASPSAGFW